MHAYITLAQSLTFGSILYRPGHGVVDAQRAAQTLAFYRDMFRSEPPVALWTVGAAEVAANAAFSADILTPPPAKRPRDSHNGLEPAPAAPSPAVAPLLSSSPARELKLRELVYDTVLASPDGSVSMSDLIALVKVTFPGNGDKDLAGDIERVCAPDSGGKSPLCFADGNVSLCFTEAGAGKGETTSLPTEFSVKHFIYDIVFASDNGIVPIDQLLAAVRVERPDAYRGYDNLLKAHIQRCRMHDEAGKLLMYFSNGCCRLTDIAMRLAKKAAANPSQEGRAEELELTGAEAQGGSGPAAKQARARKPRQWYAAMRVLMQAKEQPSDEELLRVIEMHGGGDGTVTLLAAQCNVLERRKRKLMEDSPTPAPAMAPEPAPPVVEALPEAQAPIPVVPPTAAPTPSPPPPPPPPRPSMPPKKQEEPQLFALKPTEKVLSPATAPVTAAPKLKPASVPASAPVAEPAQTAPAQQAPSRLPGALAGLAGGARSLLVKLGTKCSASPPTAAAQPQEDGGHPASPDAAGGLFRGVYHGGGKFHSQVFKDTAFLYVGAYSTAEEAARAHDDLSRKLGLDERQMNYPAANYPAAGILCEPPAASSPAHDKQPSVEIDPDAPFRLQMHNPSSERELYFAVGVTPTTKLEKVMRAVARKLEAPVTSFELLYKDTKILLVGETVNDAQLDAVHNQVLIRHIVNA